MKFNEKIIMGRFDNRPKNEMNEKIIYKERPQPKQAEQQRLTDKEGLDKAYASNEKLLVQGDTMYVAGTSNVQDALDTLKIPFGKTAEAQRYKDADALLAKNPQVSNLVGHSLGGSAVLELQKNHGDRTFKTNTYNAPVNSITRPDNVNNHRYRNYGDVFSALDRQAETSFKPDAAIHYAKAYMDKDPKEFWNGVLDAHTYENLSNRNVSDIQSISSIDTF
jgi:hypothetical protein